MTVAGLTGVAMGAVFRNTAAAIATFAGVFFVIPPLAGLLPASISNHLAPYLPSNAREVLPDKRRRRAGHAKHAYMLRLAKRAAAARRTHP